jgi:DNA polymerase-1
VRHWIDAVEKAAETDGEARSLYGRRRTVAGLEAWERAGYPRAPRWAAHHIISATVADITKLSIARLYDALPEGCRLLLPLADGVLMEVPQGRVKEVAKIIRQALEEPPTDFSVPLRVKLSCGRTWADCKRRPQRVEQVSDAS